MLEQFPSFFAKYVSSFESLKIELASAIGYSLLPTGKIFRPKVFLNLCEDLKVQNQKSALYFASFLEIHHAYSLVHDDLPCMDNSEFRRGKLSVHKKYGEYQAVLTGDALLNLSYQALFESQAPLKLFQFSAKLMGVAGLIEGQAKDLANRNYSFEEILHIHQLKTGNLILLAVLGAYFFTDKKKISFSSFYKLGREIGKLFQIRDDLEDRDDQDEGLNLFRLDEKRALLEFNKTKETVFKKLKNYQLVALESYLKNFF
jgi:geranylgeranyl pyrophosphate synthase